MAETAQVVVIGAGAIGTSIAYNLAKKGIRDVVVVEKNFPASGSTGRCAAGVREQFGTEMNCRLAQASINRFERLNEELEYDGDIQFVQQGYLCLAYSEKEMTQFRRNVELQHSLGIPSVVLTPEGARKIVPDLNLEGLVGATFCREDGFCNPHHTTDAYFKAGKRLGVRYELFTEVTAIKRKGDRLVGVVTDQGEISCEMVVNAAGPWARNVGRMIGVDLPVRPERKQMLVTEPFEHLWDPMLMSFHYEVAMQQTPHGSALVACSILPEPENDIGSSWRFMEEGAKIAQKLIPLLGQVRIVRQWAGMYEITPDHQPIYGGIPGLEGYLMAVGFSGHGFMLSPVTGEIIAQMIAGEEPAVSVEKLDLGRFERGELVIEPSVV